MTASDAGEAVFTVDYGRRYQFSSIATDWSGNQQPIEGRGYIEGEVVSPWQSKSSPLDVDADGTITTFDALIVVSWLYSAETMGEPSLIVECDAEQDVEPPFPDVNGDGWVSPFDVLLIVSYLYEQQDNEEAELMGG